MPELNPSPKFPITEKPRLSPNPKSTLEYKDGGRGTPVIVNTPPQHSIDPTEESAEIENLQNQINGKQDKLTFDSAPTQNSTNPVTSGGIYNALQNVGGEDIVTITATGVQSDEMDAKIQNAKALYWDSRLYTKFQEDSSLIDFVCQDQTTSQDLRYQLEYTKSSKTLAESAVGPYRVSSINSKRGNVSIDNSLQTTGSNTAGTLGLSGKLPYLDTAPSADNTSGFMTIVVLSSEPATRYDGYLYVITSA